MKTTLLIIAGVIGIAVTAFTLEVAGLKWREYFEPKHRDVDRTVFEQSKSYVHGKTQDLAKYYEEWSKAEPEDRAAIEGLIKMNFAEFDDTNIQNPKLRAFLVDVRGY